MAYLKSRCRFNLLKKIGVWQPIEWLYCSVITSCPTAGYSGTGQDIFDLPLQLPSPLFLLCSMPWGYLACVCRPFALGLLLGFSSFSTTRRSEGRCTLRSGCLALLIPSYWVTAACLSWRSQLLSDRAVHTAALQLGNYSLPLSASGLGVGWLPALGRP